MILLIDNYDSFTYNLYQLIGSIESDIRVIRNDEGTISEIETQNPHAIILSPGPGRPEQAGISLDVIRCFAGKLPILGVCLGHQAICQAFGGVVTYAKECMHGKTSLVRLLKQSPIFQDVPLPLQAGRYHSLIVGHENLPDCLEVIAESLEDEIMAIKHREYPIYGLQFHPESILTKDGDIIIRNFIDIARNNEKGMVSK